MEKWVNHQRDIQTKNLDVMAVDAPNMTFTTGYKKGSSEMLVRKAAIIMEAAKKSTNTKMVKPSPKNANKLHGIFSGYKSISTGGTGSEPSVSYWKKQSENLKDLTGAWKSIG